MDFCDQPERRGFIGSSHCRTRTTSVRVRHLTVSGLLPRHRYYCQVEAVNLVGDSPFTATVSDAPKQR
jgi:hypothetical protein